MATPHACAALVGVLPGLLRVKRDLVGSSGAPSYATLSVVRQLRRPRVSEVADHLGLDLSTVSRHVAQLRDRGLVDACPDPDDGRSHRLVVTAAGTQALRQYRHDLVDRLVERLSDWDDSDVGTLTALLARLDDVPDPSCAPPPPGARPAPLGSPIDEPALHSRRTA